MSRENIEYCSQVCSVAFFESHRNAIVGFPGMYVSDWTMALNTCSITKDFKDTVRREDTAEKARTAQNPCRPVKGEQTYLEIGHGGA